MKHDDYARAIEHAERMLTLADDLHEMGMTATAEDLALTVKFLAEAGFELNVAIQGRREAWRRIKQDAFDAGVKFSGQPIDREIQWSGE